MFAKKTKLMTLCLVHQHPKILLGMKKIGFGKGRWNGFGGKVESGETIENAAKRELFEEVGIKANQIEKVGILQFEPLGVPDILEVHIFKTTNFSGEPKESDEMLPSWFFIDQIPFKEMWPDDIHWFPLFLKGKKFIGNFKFGEGDKVLEKNMCVVEKL